MKAEPFINNHIHNEHNNIEDNSGGKEPRIKINIRDFVMGSGKTTQAIITINKRPNHKYIYVTPYIKETERIKKECVNFHLPRKGFKRKDFLDLVSKGKNIATTHSLFEQLEIEDYSLFKDYVLMLDEVTTPVKVLKASKDDVQLLTSCEQHIRIGDDNKAEWMKEDYNGKFNELKKYVKSGNVSLVNGFALVWEFPPIVFKSFRDVYILTYKFEHSILYYYFKYHKIEFRTTLTNRSLDVPLISSLKRLIDVCNEPKYNKIGNTAKKGSRPLSSTWYRKASMAQKTKVSNSTRSFFSTYCKTGSKENAYTCLKEIKDEIAADGFKSGFISSTERATNEWAHKTSMSYLINLYMHPTYMHYFGQEDIEINQDEWALSEMIQWLWRGCIRNDQPMKVFIPSERMRNIFLKWLDGSR